MIIAVMSCFQGIGGPIGLTGDPGRPGQRGLPGKEVSTYTLSTQ